MKRIAVVFEAPRRVRAVREAAAGPGRGEIGVRVRRSAVSAGSELLLFRGEAPQGAALDESLPALQGPIRFPLRYGYAAVGEVVSTGPDADPAWVGRRVFCFHPHASFCTLRPADAVPLPEDVDERDALFLANAETAVTLVLDGSPALGERVVVLGQGTVGLLTAALLARHPLMGLYTVDPLPRRREASVQAGADAAFDSDGLGALHARLQADTGGALADLVYELTGNPEALNDAIDLAGAGARIVVGSWYGSKPAALNLGGRFHRGRLRLVSSQVSTLPHHLLGRWDRTRRLNAAWEMIRRIRPSRWISHEFEAEQAAEAYALLDRRRGQALQVVLNYD